MKRLNKLNEARAIVSQSRRHVISGLNGLMFNKQDRAVIGPQLNEAVSKELDRLVELIEALIDEAAGGTK